MAAEYSLSLSFSLTHTLDFRPKGVAAALTQHFLFNETSHHCHKSGPEPSINLRGGAHTGISGWHTLYDSDVGHTSKVINYYDNCKRKKQDP